MDAKRTIPAVVESDKFGDLWSAEAVAAQMSFLQGEVLTVVDAAVVGPQLKAVKDLVRKAFADRQRWMQHVMNKPAVASALHGRGSASG
jgi:glutathione S-transferase